MVSKEPPGAAGNADATYISARRESFLSATPDYERTRPQYPLQAISWALGSKPIRVADLGCGPGKLTQQLSDLGHVVVGIDPSMVMLRGMVSRGLPALNGVAEWIPLKTASTDTVTAAQAFHWFDHERAVPEMHRVLRRSGTAALFWNLRDESQDWVRELSGIIGSEDAIPPKDEDADRWDTEIASSLSVAGRFHMIEQRIFRHHQEIDEEGLVGLVRSRSYIAVLPTHEQVRVLAQVRRLCGEHPQLVGRKTFDLPYRTRVFRAVAR